MNVINQFATLFGVCCCGVFLAQLLPFPMPASVVSMLVMFGLLSFGVISEGRMKEISDFFLSHMVLFFIPAGVAILEHVDTLRAELPVLALILVLSTATTFLTTAAVVWATRRLLAHRRRKAG